jgi:hypothetical protein
MWGLCPLSSCHSAWRITSASDILCNFAQHPNWLTQESLSTFCTSCLCTEDNSLIMTKMGLFTSCARMILEQSTDLFWHDNTFRRSCNMPVNWRILVYDSPVTEEKDEAQYIIRTVYFAQWCICFAVIVLGHQIIGLMQGRTTQGSVAVRIEEA